MTNRTKERYEQEHDYSKGRFESKVQKRKRYKALTEEQLQQFILSNKEECAEIRSIAGKGHYVFATQLVNDQQYVCLLYTSPSPRDS